MTDRQPPPDRSYISISERLVNIVKSLNLTNILMIAILLLIAVPAYFAWKYLTDEDFRSDFRNHAQIIDKHVPCIVLQGRYYGAQSRHSIFVVYGIEGRNEKVIGVRAPGTLTDPEIEETCQKVLATAAELKK
jgi:hypothetical protein